MILRSYICLCSQLYKLYHVKTVEIKQKLHHYIETAQDKKLKAIYAMVEDEIQETYDYWNDQEFWRN